MKKLFLHSKYVSFIDTLLKFSVLIILIGFNYDLNFIFHHFIKLLRGSGVGILGIFKLEEVGIADESLEKVEVLAFEIELEEIGRGWSALLLCNSWIPLEDSGSLDDLLKFLLRLAEIDGNTLVLP